MHICVDSNPKQPCNEEGGPTGHICKAKLGSSLAKTNLDAIAVKHRELAASKNSHVRAARRGALLALASPFAWVVLPSFVVRLQSCASAFQTFVSSRQHPGNVFTQPIKHFTGEGMRTFVMPLMVPTAADEACGLRRLPCQRPSVPVLLKLLGREPMLRCFWRIFRRLEDSELEQVFLQMLDVPHLKLSCHCFGNSGSDRHGLVKAQSNEPQLRALVHVHVFGIATPHACQYRGDRSHEVSFPECCIMRMILHS